MTSPVHVPAYETPEPGAIVFINDPYATGFTDDEITILLTGQGVPLTHVDEAGFTAAAEVMTGAMVAFIPRAEDAEHLALEGGEPVEQIHCTSIYLGDAVDFDDERRGDIIAQLTDIASSIGPIVANVFGVAIFNPSGDEPCFVYIVGGQELSDAQDVIYEMSEDDDWRQADQHQPWIAHITGGYDAEPRKWMTDDVMARTGPILFDRIRVAFGGVNTDIPLGDEAAITAAVEQFHLQGKHNQLAHGKKTSVSAADHEKFQKKMGKARTGEKAQGACASADDYTPKPDKFGNKEYGKKDISELEPAIRMYQTRADGINTELRSHGNIRDAFPAANDGIDARQFDRGFSRTMERSPIKHDIVVERGIRDPHRTFGDSWSDTGSNAGLQWTDHGYSSVTTDSSVSHHFATMRGEWEAENQHPVVMRMYVPEGTRGFAVGHQGQEQYAWEKEIILDRNLDFRIMTDHGVGADGIHRVDVEVMGPSGESDFQSEPTRRSGSYGDNY